MRFACDTGGTFTDLVVEADDTMVVVFDEGSMPEPDGRGIRVTSLTADGERVDVPSGGPPKGAVRIIQRAAQGPGRQTEEYRDIHHEYSAVAEAAVRREEIPLTRRDYIRDYFQAVRPQ